MVVSNKGFIFGPMGRRDDDKAEHSILDNLPNFMKESIRGHVDSRVLVEAKRGAVVYCDLVGDYAEHSGIYVGNGQIVNLEGDGKIRKVTFKEFIKGTTGEMIYVSCKGGKSVGSDKVADRALSMVGKSRDYNMIMDNCHQFAAGCLTGDFESAMNFLWMLKDEAYKAYGANQWFRCYGEPKKSIVSILPRPTNF